MEELKIITGSKSIMTKRPPTNNLMLDSKLHYHSGNGDLKNVKLFIKRGANIHAEDFLKRTALMIACECGHFEVVKYLVEVGSDIHLYKDWCVQCSAMRGYLNIVEYLIEKGAGYRNRDDIVLLNAAQNGQLEVVQFLFKLGCPIEKIKNVENEVIRKWLKAKELAQDLANDLTIKDIPKEEKKKL